VLGYNLGNFFSQTHLVTLLPREKWKEAIWSVDEAGDIDSDLRLAKSFANGKTKGGTVGQKQSDQMFGH
jgi:hypothetical protein